ncbi:MAG: CYTH and CHAD domain-containing protein [Myxococcota bacterium]
MESNREIELKLTVAPDDAERILDHPLLRSPAAAAPEVLSLHTVYFDTRDRALAEAGVGLRLRRDGARQWQTVKLGDRSAAGLFDRTEIEFELPGERPDLLAIPDDDVRERLIGIVAEQPLEPVYETRFERAIRRVADDVGEWSFCLDRGEIRAGFAQEPICEIELENHSGPPSHLFDVALELALDLPLAPALRSKAERGERLCSGEPLGAARAEAIELAEDVRAGAAIAVIARACLAQIGENAELVATREDPEPVHQMRVGLRRMRALIALVRREVPSARIGRLRGGLRTLAGLLGDVRDLDVFIAQRIDPLLRLRSDDLALTVLREEAVALREDRRTALRATLRSGRPARLLLELGRWAAALEEIDGAEADGQGPLGRRADVFARTALGRLDRKARKQAATALVGSPAARHDFRIALKKLRYAAEFFRSLYGRKASKRHLRRLGRLLDLLGAQNDVETAQQLIPILLERCPPERAVELARAAGIVEGHAIAEQERSLAELERRWQRFEAAGRFWQPD